LSADIGDAIPVRSAIGPFSLPTFFMDEWTAGTPGWIHTSYDNSTSTTTLSWVEADDLEDQLKVVALSLARIVLLKGDINKDHKVDIFDIVLAALALDSEPGDPNWNQAADLNADDIVDIFDIVILANNFGE